MTNVTPVSADDLRGLQRELDDKGFAVLRGVVAQAPLAALAAELYAAYDASEKFEGGGAITGHLNCFPGPNARFIYDEIEAHGIVDAVQAMRPGRQNRMRATMNFNLPGSVAQHYHMDGLYTEDFLICNVAVIDTDLVNGAIDLLPGTNREFMPFWKYAVRRCNKLSTRLEMSQGDVLLRRSTLWHRGMPNRSATPRPMASLTFGEVSAPDDDPRAQYANPVSFYPNWYSTSRMGILRERLYTAAPVTYSAYRFAKSIGNDKGYSAY